MTLGVGQRGQGLGAGQQQLLEVRRGVERRRGLGGRAAPHPPRPPARRRRQLRLPRVPGGGAARQRGQVWCRGLEAGKLVGGR